MRINRLLLKAALFPVMLLGAGGSPAAGPVGPGGPPPGGPPSGGPGEPEEQALSLAEILLADYGTLKDLKAVSFVLDLGLMGPVEETGKTVFAEGHPVTEAEKTQAVDAIQTLALRGTVEVPDLSTVKSRGELARMLYETMTAGLPGLPELHYNEKIRVQEGTKVIDNAYVFFAGGNAVENGGTSELVVKNSTIRGTTTKKTKCLSGPPSGLTVGGSIRTTLAVHQSQGFYINSKVISKDWAVFSTDGAEPIGREGEKELSIYTYGTEGVATDAGYGTYSDLFCNAFFYGSRMTAPELGAISGTFGTLTLDTIAAGEENPMLAKHLSDADKVLQPDKTLGSHLTGGRNAIMIHCVSLPPYWVRPGYSQKELPLHEGVVTVRHSTLETDLSLDKHIQYPEQVSAYLAHVAGSVILVRSCNARILLEDVKVLPDPNGTGAILHTAINSDLPLSSRCPTEPPILAVM